MNPPPLHAFRPHVAAFGAASALVAGLMLAGIVPAGAGGPAVDQSADFPVSPMDISRGAANYSPVIAADPADPRFVAIAAQTNDPGRGCRLYLSGDGGRRWTPADRLGEPLSAGVCSSPQVAFGPGGDLIYTFVVLGGAEQLPVGVFLARSPDRGRTFNRPRQILGSGIFPALMTAGFHGKSPRIHLAWTQAAGPGMGDPNASGGRIMSAFSDDGGKTFSDPVAVGDPGRPGGFPAVAAGPGGDLHVSFLASGSNGRGRPNRRAQIKGSELMVARSSNGGSSFDGGVVVKTGLRLLPGSRDPASAPSPALAAGPGGRVCAGWTDPGASQWDVEISCSPDGGRRWKTRALPPEPFGGKRLERYLPQLSFSPEGRLDALYLAGRRERRGGFHNVFYARSGRGGAFGPPVRVSDRPSPHDPRPEAAGVAASDPGFGGRLGLLSTPGGVVAAWPDTRNARAGSGGRDVFSDVIGLRRWATPASIKWAGSLLFLNALLFALVWRGGKKQRAAGR